MLDHRIKLGTLGSCPSLFINTENIENIGIEQHEINKLSDLKRQDSFWPEKCPVQ